MSEPCDSAAGEQRKEHEFTVAVRLWDATLDGRIEWEWDPTARRPCGPRCEEYRAEFNGTTYRVSEWGLQASGAIEAIWTGPAVSDLFRLCAARHDREAKRAAMTDAP